MFSTDLLHGNAPIVRKSLVKRRKGTKNKGIERVTWPAHATQNKLCRASQTSKPAAILLGLMKISEFSLCHKLRPTLAKKRAQNLVSVLYSSLTASFPVVCRAAFQLSRPSLAEKRDPCSLPASCHHIDQIWSRGTTIALLKRALSSQNAANLIIGRLCG